MQTPHAHGRVFNIEGGPTCQRQGQDYITDFYDFIGATLEDAVYRDTPCWGDCYETRESHRTLRYQSRPDEQYVGEMRQIVGSLTAG